MKTVGSQYENSCMSNHALENGVANIKKEEELSDMRHGEKFSFLSSGYSFEIIEQMSNYIREKSQLRPRIAVICGSGLGSLADIILDSTVISYEEIPHFPPSTVPGHAGELVIGLLDGIPVIAMKGRLHLYEGYPLWLCSMPVRVMKLLGVRQIVITCAAGGLNPSYKTGDIMIIKDHVNLQGLIGNSPLVGKHDERFGPRFFPMNKTYDSHYREIAKRIATDMGISDSVREGVHVMVGGPNYETIAELQFLRLMGIDSVGMSTVHEVLVARQCSMRVFAFCLITNECVTEYDCNLEANHEEVLQTAEQRQETLKLFVTKIVAEMAKPENSIVQPIPGSSAIPEHGYVYEESHIA
ncbi:purine nucleoside phosphorylase-like isoform X1 [Artemia franciscana]|uniref:purine nucleoside phosphorylase-like isoform X1 n=2 Tax=Artemia franciscana TaxID=6661 RepID=UPI0032DACEF6